jgi:hypothetical protein
MRLLEPSQAHYKRAARLFEDASSDELRATAEVLVRYDHGKLRLEHMRLLDLALGRPMGLARFTRRER